jgi:hypothetical protein
MKITMFIFLALMSLSSLGFEDCEQLSDSCEYYSCIEGQKSCGKRGYVLGFGKKYCNKFEEHSYKFTTSGKNWILDVRSCLIDNLGQTSTELSCRKYKKAQIKSHIPCYLNSGYCSLPKADKKLIRKIVYKTMWRPSFIVSAIKVLKTCD